MTYIDFRSRIEQALMSSPAGLTWSELKTRLDLPYEKPCYTWIARLEQDIALTRWREGRSIVWKLNQQS
jgi:hypothetical protein